MDSQEGFSAAITKNESDDGLSDIRKHVETLFKDGNADDNAESSHATKQQSRRALGRLMELCKSQDSNVDIVIECNGIEALVAILKRHKKLYFEWHSKPNNPCSPQFMYAEDILKETCFVLGRLAIKAKYQDRISAGGALSEMMEVLQFHTQYPDLPTQSTSGGVARRACDAVTNLAHENAEIKEKVREENGIPPLVRLLQAQDVKVQRAAAGALRTLAFKNDANKHIIVEQGALQTLIMMLCSDDDSTHYEAIGVIGNLVHSSQNIKHQVLLAGALQPVIELLRSTCTETQREAALLIGQFATPSSQAQGVGGLQQWGPIAVGDQYDHNNYWKIKIMQRGAVPPLISMLSSSDDTLREMSAFAIGRLAQNNDNQAGIVSLGGLVPLIRLLESQESTLQHNAAFALYGLSDNEDNIPLILKSGAYQTLKSSALYIQQSKDCVQKTIKRLRDKVEKQPVLERVLYVLKSGGGGGGGGGGQAPRYRVASSLCDLCGVTQLQRVLVGSKGLGILLSMLTCSEGMWQKEAARTLHGLIKRLKQMIEQGTKPPPPPRAPKYPWGQYVNSPDLSDVVFIIENRPYYAHRIALGACSEAFTAMFQGDYQEKSKDRQIPIPNIQWDVWHAMMNYIYTGQTLKTTPPPPLTRTPPPPHPPLKTKRGGGGAAPRDPEGTINSCRLIFTV